MKQVKRAMLGLDIVVLALVLASMGKVMAAGGMAELTKILEAGLEGFIAYLDWLLEVLKVIWRG